MLIGIATYLLSYPLLNVNESISGYYGTCNKKQYHSGVHYIDCHRYLIEHNHLHKKDDVLAQQLLRGLVRLDPSCPEVLQLTELLLAKGV